MLLQSFGNSTSTASRMMRLDGSAHVSGSSPNMPVIVLICAFTTGTLVQFVSCIFARAMPKLLVRVTKDLALPASVTSQFSIEMKDSWL